MARHSSTTTRDGHTATAPLPALSAPPTEEAAKGQDKAADYHNEHDLGIDEQLNARFEHGLRDEDGGAEKS